MTNNKSGNIFLSDFSLVNALGNNNKDIKQNMLAGIRAGLVERDGLLNEGSLFVGEVNANLPLLEVLLVYLKVNKRFLLRMTKVNFLKVMTTACKKCSI